MVKSSVFWTLSVALLASVLVCGVPPVRAETGKVETFQFQAEVTRLMDILIHSLYSNRDVFLRELISNANDAIDKIRFQSLTDPTALAAGEDLHIKIKVDLPSRTITIEDSGVGMTKQEMVNNLGTIAKSGTSAFLEQISKDSESGAGANTANLIGQFGVGFYSAFLVADKITVVSKNNNDPKQWRWSSKTNSGFTIKEDDSETLGRGTKVILEVKEDAAEYLDIAHLEELIKRYSEFIVFPIYVYKEVPETPEPEELQEEEEGEEPVIDGDALDESADAPEPEELREEEEGEEPVIDGDALDESADGVVDPETPEDEDIADEESAEQDGEEIVSEEEIISEEEDLTSEEGEEAPPKYDWSLVNDVKPLWTRDPSEISEKEYVSFFKSIAKTDEEPLTYIHFKAEGDVEFRGLLYIPKKPIRSLTHVEEKARKDLVRLYVRRVLVTDTVEDGLLPAWLSMIVGIVDSDDLPINVSRETLQQSKTLTAIKKKLLRKSLEAIKIMMDKEPYEPEEDDPRKPGSQFLDFWKVYGPTLKMGLVQDVANRDRLAKIVRFKSSKTALRDPNDVITLEDYMLRAKEGQDYIYVHSGESLDAVKSSPFTEQLVDLGYEVIYLVDPVDEFLLQYYQEFQGTKLMAVAKDNFRLGSEDDEVIRTKAKRGRQSIKSLLTFMKETLGSDKVSSVRASMKLTRSACALSSEQFGYTARMETVMRAQALANPEKLQTVPKQKVMEVNPYHPIVEGLNTLIKEDPQSEKAADIINVLYDAALVASGYYLHDHTEHGIRISKLMAKTLGMDPNVTFEEPPMPDMSEVDDDKPEKVEVPIDFKDIPMGFGDDADYDADGDGIDLEGDDFADAEPDTEMEVEAAHEEL
eukprot:CAMPEP_0184753208 /NCGR_PEP_ID=MMETSP0315-20130426/43981_1 /TAXON_ID=101924 /ORGANISM="Rhodosorus marinus, Strain UTEX LB 2760" /LENGTH=869 /DNA_ID=CAMNT_0027232577 /DNA_START=71 /DNA_END=2681 /DNA_ORIENTATION=-